MSEMVKNFAMLVWLACAMNSSTMPARAQGIREEKAMTTQGAAVPTLVYGKAQQSDGATDEVLLEQPDNSVNPLGNPLPEVIEQQPAAAVVPAGQNVAPQPLVKTGESPAGAAVPQTGDNPAGIAPQNLGTKFQNTLMEANGMVYDVQAYPAEDLKAIGNPSNPETIYSPNVNP